MPRLGRRSGGCARPRVSVLDGGHRPPRSARSGARFRSAGRRAVPGGGGALPPPGAGRGWGHRPGVAGAPREDGGLGGGAACPLQLSPCFFLSHLRHSCEGRSALCKHLRAPMGARPWGPCSCGARSWAAGRGRSEGPGPRGQVSGCFWT